MLFMWVGYQGVSASGVKEDSLSHVGNKGSWYLKTSLPAWGAAIVNVAGEWDCADRWSLALDLGVVVLLVLVWQSSVRSGYRAAALKKMGEHLPNF